MVFKFFNLFCFLSLAFTIVECFILINQSPLVGDYRSTSFVCVAIPRTVSRREIIVWRSFPWRWISRAPAPRTIAVLKRRGFRKLWSNNQNNALGAFECGAGNNKVISYKARTSGKLRAAAFSKVTSSGSNVTIRMFAVGNAGENVSHFANVEWLKNGQRLKNSSGKFQQSEDGNTLTVRNVNVHDAGVYMAHYKEQDAFLAAATILIVQKCPENKWSADCLKTCPACENGATCRSFDGRCVCPPGFRGKTCEEACPRNTFGPECSISCSDLLGVSSCRSLQICGTTGCACASGWTGPNCDQPCGQGTFGASCTQTCMCERNRACDAQQGCVCSGGMTETHCEGRDEETEFPKVALRSMIPTRFQALKILDVTADPSFKLNQDEDVTISCSVSGHPVPEHGDIVVVKPDETVIHPIRTSTTSSATVSVFNVLVTSSNPGPYRCLARTSSGEAERKFNFSIPVLPSPISPPILISKSYTELVVDLNSRNYSGSGPILKRILFFKAENETQYRQYTEVGENETVKVSRLSPNTLYSFRVVLHRPGGNNGIGSPGPVSSFRTNCPAPKNAPKILFIHATNKTILYISWRNPQKEKFGGEILGYLLQYRDLGILNDQWKQISIPNGQTNSITIKNMMPLTVYEVKIQSRNCGGMSPFSKPVRVAMRKLASPSSPSVFVYNRTARSVSLRWNVPKNTLPHSIVTYELYKTLNMTSPSGTVRHQTNTSERHYTFEQLEPDTTYSFRVRAYNYNGPGLFSEFIFTSTKEDAPSAPYNVSSFNVQLDSATLSWKRPKQCNGYLKSYDVELSKDGENWTRTATNDNRTQIEMVNLDEHTSYYVRVRGNTAKNGLWSEMVTIQTMDTSPLKPPVITSVEVTSPCSVIVTWNPPPTSSFLGNITSYNVIYTDDIRQSEEHWDCKIVPGLTNSIQIDGLRSDTVYFFKVAATSQKMGEYSETATERTARLDLPPPPYNESFFNVSSNKAVVSWSVMEGYRITVVKLKYRNHGSNYITRLAEAGEKSQMILSDLLPNKEYKVELIARNHVGDSSGNPVLRFSTKALTSPSTDNSPTNTAFEKTLIFKLVLGALGVLVVVVMAMMVTLYCRYRTKAKASEVGVINNSPNNVEMDSVSTFLRASTYGSLCQTGPSISRSGTLLSSYSVHSGNSRAPSTYSMQMFPENLIILWENILFEDIPLGMGNFGQVVKAVVQKDNQVIPVAVKMLKDGSTVDDKRDFMAELDTMVRIGNHKNVVTLIGACERDNAMYLCTEFAPLGNLLQFLRKSRRMEDTTETYTTLSQTQLLEFAHDVAEGMAYLSEKQIIHRDLAARNILLGEGYVCKIADFGLSRGEGVYVKKTVSRLPIRWMAIESLNYNVYTSKSDVWSFGILLWEIVALGGTPYCGMSCAELYDKLPSGYRMEKPMNCDDEVYSVMVQCWKDRPYDRPSFSQLCVALERMSDARCSRNYVNTAIFEDFKFANIDVTEEEEG